MALTINSAYSTQTKKKSSFQEEDFPALVTKAQPLKPAACSRSAWSKNTPLNKPSQAPSSSRPAPPFSSDCLSSSSSMKKKGGKSQKAPSPPLSSDEEGKGLTQQELRSVPTMLDISSLLTVKGDNRTSTTSSPPDQSPNLDPPFTSVGKKKRRHKNNAAAAAAAAAGAVVPGVTRNPISVETVAQKENVPEKPWNKLLFNAGTETVTNGVESAPPEMASTPPLEAVETSQPTSEPELIEEEEEFPALTSKNPPPGTHLHHNLHGLPSHVLIKPLYQQRLTVFLYLRVQELLPNKSHQSAHTSTWTGRPSHETTSRVHRHPSQQ